MFRQKAINLMKPVTQGPRRGVRLPAVDQTYDGRPVLERGDLTNSAMMTHDAATIDLNAPKRDGVYSEYSRAVAFRGTRMLLDVTRPEDSK